MGIGDERGLSALFYGLGLSVGRVERYGVGCFRIRLRGPSRFLGLRARSFIGTGHLLLEGVVRDIAICRRGFIVSFGSNVRLRM